MPRQRPPGGIPRGPAQTGPTLFSYGFRPFYLSAAIWAVLEMILWLLALSGRISLGGEAGAAAWHAHEMLFGFAPAVLCGYLLTSVPNWTGQLPVSGPPLMALWGLWCAGRLAMSLSAASYPLSAAIDWLFLPVLLMICLREVVAGRKWKDLKAVAALLALTLANTLHHWTGMTTGDTGIATRLALSVYLLLISVIGGMMVPSFTRNWLNRQGSQNFPASQGRFDKAAVMVGLVALLAWTLAPETAVTATAACVAGSLHAIRLSRWKGAATFRTPLVLALHVAYACLPLGLFGVCASALGYVAPPSVLHLFGVGAVAGMMLVVMTRSTLGHTGRPLQASGLTALSHVSLFLTAVLRPLADIIPSVGGFLVMAAGLAWLLAFGLFLVEFGPLLVSTRRQARGQE
ncbi:NnrS family protein [Rhizobium sp. RU36D]|uniref:NnrS family protein n=1 Tax=Rhizobium sp. RU36D TaxID=1907415 RepID=UPI0009D8C276|nr:NnrS family protein [Rhizobium sp. RU36D]SMC73582.1 uncharacterized protein involved in response to NO [Rhizobium sp. RU36D]